MSSRNLLMIYCMFAFSSAAIVWSGNFNSYTKSSDLDNWNFNTRLGEWQTYIFGDSPSTNTASTWIALDSSYKNPADGSAKQGARVTLTSQSSWRGDTNLRTEMIPELSRTTNPQAGVRFYQWSMMQSTVNQVDSTSNHQLVFFEAHYADIQFGGNCGAKLCFLTSGASTPLWSGDFTANVWQNFALQVDYTAKTVALYFSTGSSPMVQVVSPTATSVSVSDWHVGHLRLAGGAAVTTQEIYYSSCYLTDTLTQLQTGTFSSVQSSTTEALTITSTPTSTSTSPQSTSTSTSRQTSRTSQQVSSTGATPNDCNHLSYCSEVCGAGNVKSCSCVGAELVPECAGASMLAVSMLTFCALLLTLL